MEDRLRAGFDHCTLAGAVHDPAERISDADQSDGKAALLREIYAHVRTRFTAVGFLKNCCRYYCLASLDDFCFFSFSLAWSN